ncbi:MAG: hypothetical protein HOC74_22755, partial [Gemmatimonadetes bacterium]|nr:hypothetical protein [Gemmatimonadota bacterium]
MDEIQASVDSRVEEEPIEEQEFAFASQWRLMWLRFRRHKLALVGS